MDPLSIALALLLLIESADNPDARGDYAAGHGHKAVGCLQMWKTTVDDVNRVLGKKVYTYNDRKDRSKSIEMARILLTHYGSNSRLGRKATIEDYVRIWKMPSYRGRPGVAKTKTDSHWRKARTLIMNRSYVDTLLTVMPPTLVSDVDLVGKKTVTRKDV